MFYIDKLLLHSYYLCTCFQHLQHMMSLLIGYYYIEVVFRIIGNFFNLVRDWRENSIETQWIEEFFRCDKLKKSIKNISTNISFYILSGVYILKVSY